jgi:Ca2+-binding EF-hand superfamily protein
MFKSLGRNITRQQVRDVIQEVDFDGNGVVDFEEMCVMEIKINRSRPRPDLIDHEDYLDEKTISKLQHLFLRHDMAGAGLIEKADVQRIAEFAGSKALQEEFDEIFAEADTEGTGALHFDRVAAVYTVLTKRRHRINYREFLSSEQVAAFKRMFALADTGGHGRIGRKELDQVFKHFGIALKRAQMKSLFEDFDVDGSGDIDFEEFCVMMLRLRGMRRLREISPSTCSCWDLWKNETFTIKELQNSGFGLEHFKESGIPVGTLYREGKVSALDLRRAGYTPTELRRGGVGVNELRSCGFSLAELRNAGFSEFSLKAANKTLVGSLSTGDLSPLPQRRPFTTNHFFRSKRFPQFEHGVPCPLWDFPSMPQAARQMTPMIREHTDWLPKLRPDSKGRQKREWVDEELMGVDRKYQTR